MKLKVVIDYQLWARPFIWFGLMVILIIAVVWGVMNPWYLIPVVVLMLGYFVVTRLMLSLVCRVFKVYVTEEHIIEHQLGNERTLAWADVNETNLQNWGFGFISIYKSYFPISFPKKRYIKNCPEILKFVEESGLRTNPLIVSCFGGPEKS